MVTAGDELADGWLPPLVELQHCGGSWPSYCDQLYDIFVSDFVRSVPEYAGKRVAVAGKPYPDGKHLTFWHLISEGRVEEERLPDMRRSERLRWVRALIDEGNGSQRVRCWTDRSRGELRHQIALPNFTFLVVLADRGEYNLVITAFPIEREHSQRKLRRQYEESRVPRRR